MTSQPRKDPGLVYDVGMHLGEDSAFYLAKGFRVVAFEADPGLAQHGRERFADAIASGRLILIEGAIVSEEHAGSLCSIGFYKNERISVWGTTLQEWNDRNAMLGASGELIEVEPVSFERSLQEHGVPSYLKIDIEGSDLHCVHALRKFRELPDYLSLESSKEGFDQIKAEVDLLVELGYSSFQAIEQSTLPDHQSEPDPPLEGAYSGIPLTHGCSGLFGKELGDKWLDPTELLRLYADVSLGYQLFGDAGLLLNLGQPELLGRVDSVRRELQRRTGHTVPGWYDTHARHATASE